MITDLTAFRKRKVKSLEEDITKKFQELGWAKDNDLIKNYRRFSNGEMTEKEEKEFLDRTNSEEGVELQGELMRLLLERRSLLEAENN